MAFDLEREVLSCTPVVVTAYGQTIRCFRSCCLAGISLTKCDINKGVDFQKPGDRFLVYPNPVHKGSNLTIEIDNPGAQVISISLLNLTGRILAKKTTGSINGYTQYTMTIDPRWAAGTYFVQVTETKGRILKQGKIIVL